MLQLQALINKDLDAIPGITHWFVDDYGTRPVSRIFTGPDAATVTKFAADLAQQMRQIPLSPISSPRPRSIGRSFISSRIRMLMAKLGVSTESLAETIRIATIGDAGPALARFDRDGRLIPIRAEYRRKRAPRSANARSFGSADGYRRFRTARQNRADLKVGDGPVSIHRFDRARSATVQADLVGNAALGDVETALNKLPLMQHLPPDVKVRKSASTEAMDDLSSGFAEAMRNGLILVYVVLVLLFASFLQPITILFSLPLSIGGAILALLVTGRPLSMPVIIGILMLMGIVTKNAIMIVDFSTAAMAKGMAAHQGRLSKPARSGRGRSS